MPTEDPRVDAYIAAAAPFARPLLGRFRAAVHAGAPAAEETIKWSMPHFLLDGRILAHMAAFKRHCAFGFRHAEQLLGADAVDGAMGQFGRVVDDAGLGSNDRLVALVRRAAALAGTAPAPRRPARARPAPDTPPKLRAALDALPAAARQFAAFPPGKRREYCDWIAEAKREDTRARRVAQAVAWIAEGKGRNWKYENCR